MDKYLAEWQTTNCKGCYYAELKKVGTGLPCCTSPIRIFAQRGKCLSYKETKIMARTNYKLFWFTFLDGWNPDGTPIIKTHPSKGVSIGHAEERLKREYPRAQMIGQATLESISEYQSTREAK